MDTEKAIEILNRQIDRADPLKQEVRFLANFQKWKRDTEVAIEKIFGNESRHGNDFKGINYYLTYRYPVDEDIQQNDYVNGLEAARQILHSMISEINEFGIKSETTSLKLDSLRIIKNICSRFHLMARQLRARHQNRETLDITDEYDVQDLFHALLHLHFDDIRPEEWTPSYAGGSSRMDFLLKKEQIVIELKKTRKGLSTQEVGKQLIIDKDQYKNHPECECLVCFVYDPDGYIKNPLGFESDLTEETDKLKTVVIVAPKGH